MQDIDIVYPTWLLVISINEHETWRVQSQNNNPTERDGVQGCVFICETISDPFMERQQKTLGHTHQLKT